jgi:hypothetical protein
VLPHQLREYLVAARAGANDDRPEDVVVIWVAPCVTR